MFKISYKEITSSLNPGLFEDLKSWQELEFKYNYLKDKVSTDEGKTKLFEIKQDLIEVQEKIIPVIIEIIRSWLEPHSIAYKASIFYTIVIQDFSKGMNYLNNLNKHDSNQIWSSSDALHNIRAKNYILSLEDKEELKHELKGWLYREKRLKQSQIILDKLKNSKTISDKNIAITLALNLQHNEGKLFEDHSNLTLAQLNYLSNMDTSPWIQQLSRVANLIKTSQKYMGNSLYKMTDFLTEDEIKESKDLFTLPENHLPAMKVPKGGASCSVCSFWKDNQCTNKYYIKWNESGKIPYPADEYCSDWFTWKEVK